jgi:hypothetical protein
VSSERRQTIRSFFFLLCSFKKEDLVPAGSFFYTIAFMKEHNRTIPESMYAILAIVIAIGLYIVFAMHETQSTRIGTCSGNYNSMSRTWTVSGTRTSVTKIELVLEEDADSNLSASDQALSMAGTDISLIRDSKAVSVSFQEENEKISVTITIDPEYLTSNDYTYLNANDLVVIGTMDWNRGVSEALAAIENDGTGTGCQLTQAGS